MPDITHDYIRAIVGAEPQEWWPSTNWDPVCEAFENPDDHDPLPASLAYHAFVGAAVEWLARRGTVGADGLDSPTFAVGWKGNRDTTKHESTCLLSALVAAIREVKK